MSGGSLLRSGLLYSWKMLLPTFDPPLQRDSRICGKECRSVQSWCHPAIRPGAYIKKQPKPTKDILHLRQCIEIRVKIVGVTGLLRRALTSKGQDQIVGYLISQPGESKANLEDITEGGFSYERCLRRTTFFPEEDRLQFSSVPPRGISRVEFRLDSIAD